MCSRADGSGGRGCSERKSEWEIERNGKRREREREKVRGYVVDGRIRKKGMRWVSTGVSWLVWWANVCLLAASEPVNHYGPRKRLPTTFVLSSRSLSLSSFSLRLPRILRFLSLSLSFSIPSRRFSFLPPSSHPVLPLTRFPSTPFPSPFISRSLSCTFVPFISLSTKFTPLLRATSTLQCCPPPPILHI